MVRANSPIKFHWRAHGFTSPLPATPADGEENPSASTLVSSLGQYFLVLEGEMLGRMVVLLLRACLLGFNRPRVHPSGRSRQSTGVDSCRLLGAVRLEFLVMW